MLFSSLFRNTLSTVLIVTIAPSTASSRRLGLISRNQDLSWCRWGIRSRYSPRNGRCQYSPNRALTNPMTDSVTAPSPIPSCRMMINTRPMNLNLPTVNSRMIMTITATIAGEVLIGVESNSGGQKRQDLRFGRQICAANEKAAKFFT